MICAGTEDPAVTAVFAAETSEEERADDSMALGEWGRLGEAISVSDAAITGFGDRSDRQITA